MTSVEEEVGPDGRIYLVLRKVDEKPTQSNKAYSLKEENDKPIVIDLTEDIQSEFVIFL